MDNSAKMVTTTSNSRCGEVAVSLVNLVSSHNTYSRHTHKAAKLRSLASYCVLDSYASVNFGRANGLPLIVSGASIQSSKYNFLDYFSILSGHRRLEVACEFS